jgi:hypothetical protein
MRSLDHPFGAEAIVIAGGAELYAETIDRTDRLWRQTNVGFPHSRPTEPGTNR